MQKKITNGFTLIEILVVTIILGILCSAGVVAYKEVTSTVKEKTAYSNYKKVVKVMESEFTKCKLDKNSKIFNSHSCSLSNNPSTNMINNYINNNLKLKNPYNKNQPVAQSNVCTAGAISIASSETGSYNVSHASIKKKTKSTTLVSSKWSSNYSNSKTTKISFSCGSSGSGSATASKAKQTIYNYKPPHDGPGAGIIVDENGNMLKGQGGHACAADCFKANSKGMKNWWIMVNGQKVYPNRAGSKYRFVMAEGANPKTGNIASSCAQANCKYNFSNGTYTVLSTGKTYKAGVPPSQRKPTN